MSPRGHYVRRRLAPDYSDVKASGPCGHSWTVPYRQAREKLRAETLIRCPECRRNVRPSFDFTGRVCARTDCTNPLGSYNPGPNCHSCDTAKSEAAAAAVMRRAA